MRNFFHVFFAAAAMVILASAPALPQCVAPDATGTASIPAPCPFVAPTELMHIIDGLPAGSALDLKPRLDNFSNELLVSGSPAAGESKSFHSSLTLVTSGTGTYSSYTRTLSLSDLLIVVACQPRVPGAPLQSFDCDMVQLQGQLPAGDPDFDLLRITAGSGFGLPSPGHTTLTRVGGSWSVESFFDITYRIDFIGHPGSPFGGRSGSTTGTIRMAQGGTPQVPPVSATDNSLPVPGSVMLDPSNHPVTFAVGSFFDVFTEVSLDFAGSPTMKPPLPGASITQTLTGSASLRLSQSGSSSHVTCPLDATMRTTSSSSSGDTRTFDTEMLSLSLSGGSLPSGIRVRESPTLASTGSTKLRESPSRPSRISSFFDVFLELSLDGGQTWSPADGAVRLEMKILLPPGPPTTVESILPPGSFQGQLTGDPDFDLLRLTHNTQPPPPLPSVGNSSTVALSGGVIAGIAIGGIARSTSNVACVVRTTGASDDGSIRSFDTEMLQLDLSGGTLPAGTMIRESPSKASLGKTSVRTVPGGGGFQVSSFFDVFTELSVDGGQTWMPQTPTTLEYADTIPAGAGAPLACEPVATYPNDLFPFAGMLQIVNPGPPNIFSNGMLMRNLMLSSPTSPSGLPPLGSTDTRAIIVVCRDQMSAGAASPFLDFEATGSSTIRIVHSSDDGTERFFDTEMLSLDVAFPGGGGAGGFLLRESPTLASTGHTTVKPNGNGYKISSFFDIFTEISLDGGGTWLPAVQSTHLEQVMYAPPSAFPNTNFPPPGIFRGSPDCAEVMFANGARLRHGSFFDIFADVALPPPGGSSTHPATGRGHMELSLDGGNSFFDVFTEVSLSVQCDATNTTQATQFFDTEMLALDVRAANKADVGAIRAGVLMLRESPTLPSKGKTFLRESPTLQHGMSSFFDVFTELSLDGGQTWSPASSPMRIELDSVTSGTITGMKWHDANGNGLFEAGESKLPNWKIVLADTLGNVLDTVRTDAAGNYLFSNVASGTYRVSEEGQPGWIQTGGSPTYGFVMVPGDTNGGNDFGNFQAPNLTGVKFNDHNGDGVRDPGDEGIPGWEICLFPKNIPTPNTTMSGGTGTFSMRLNGLPPGVPVTGTLDLFAASRKGYDYYQAQSALNSGRTILKSYFENGQIPTEMLALSLQSTAPTPAGGSLFEISVSKKHTKTGHVTLLKRRQTPGAATELHSSFFDIFVDITIDESGVKRTCPTEIIFEADLLGGGVPDPLAPGMIYRSRPVALVDDQGAPVGTLDEMTFTVGPPASQLTPVCATTDAAGQYSFSPLLPGVWNILEHQQPCWEQTTPLIPPINVTSGATVPPVNFGNRQLGGKICIAKYYDGNHNQQLDPNEQPMPNVGFVLSGANAGTVVTGQTDASGSLCFTDLRPDSYTLTEIVPAGYAVSVPKSDSMHFTVTNCESLNVVWLNTAALTDTLFRSASMLDWATELKPIRCKPTRTKFKFNLEIPRDTLGRPTPILQMKFNMPIETLFVSADKIKDQPVCVGSLTIDPKRQIWIYDFAGNCPPPILTNQLVQFDGIGGKARQLTVSYVWLYPGQTRTKLKGTLPKLPLFPLDVIKQNTLLLPMPNLANVMQDLDLIQHIFPIVVGTDTHSVFQKGYKDVLKSLNAKGVFHAGPAQCLDVVKGRVVKRQLKTLPPTVMSNKLFAELLALKLNIAASDRQKFPAGFSDLIYDRSKDTVTPFDNHTIRQIALMADSALGCEQDDLGDLEYLAGVLKSINEAFRGPLDTLVWNCVKVQLKGVRPLKPVPFLRANPGIISPMNNPDADMPLPLAGFKLDQNYPNPFNPTTTISFNLPEDAVVSLTIYNMLGQEVATLLNRELLDQGAQEVEFNASNLSSGLYFYRVVAETAGDPEEGVASSTFTEVKKMLLLK